MNLDVGLSLDLNSAFKLQGSLKFAVYNILYFLYLLSVTEPSVCLTTSQDTHGHLPTLYDRPHPQLGDIVCVRQRQNTGNREEARIAGVSRAGCKDR